MSTYTGNSRETARNWSTDAAPTPSESMQSMLHLDGKASGSQIAVSSSGRDGGDHHRYAG
eukprot:7721155-Pyramimonas_sp.AAC.1